MKRFKKNLCAKNNACLSGHVLHSNFKPIFHGFTLAMLNTIKQD